MSNRRLEFARIERTSISIDVDIYEEVIVAMEEAGWECVAVDGKPYERPAIEDESEDKDA
jgi:hypothetical protein